MMEEFINSHKWGGSGIERCLFEFIINKIPSGSTVIEIGSGYCSTQAFSKIYNLFSIENNPKYINLVKDVNYIYAPISNGWYNREIVKNSIPTNYQLVFVDGPIGECLLDIENSEYHNGRAGILDNIDIFNKDSIYIFHDTYRINEVKIAMEFAKKLNKKITFYNECDFWAVVE